MKKPRKISEKSLLYARLLMRKVLDKWAAEAVARQEAASQTTQNNDPKNDKSS